MKEFLKSEIRKAVGRLAKTMLFLVKSIATVVINLVFWLMPLFLMGYLTLRLVFMSFDNEAVSPRSLGISHGQPSPQGRPGVNLPDILRSAEDMWRTLRNMWKI